MGKDVAIKRVSVIYERGGGSFVPGDSDGDKLFLPLTLRNGERKSDVSRVRSVGRGLTTAFTTAVRSAHIVAPNDAGNQDWDSTPTDMYVPPLAFSTLHPLITVPSAHNKAAPTRKLEYGA